MTRQGEKYSRTYETEGDMKIRNQITNKFKILIQMTLCGLFPIMFFIQNTLTLQEVLGTKPLLVQVISKD
jgi:hypothetical protein